MKKHLLWDLDGTLTNPKLGILTCIQHALRESGHPVPEMDELLWCIGPPLHLTFAQLVPGASDDDAWKLVAKYRERFSDVGLFENEVYAEIPGLLASLTSRNFLATSKPHVFASRILSHFGLSSHFEKIHGSELDGTRSDKGELIQYILETHKIPKDAVLMIGDRKHDILGAKKAGIPSVGITWGYGSREELAQADADFIFDDPKILQRFLRGE